MHQPSFMHPSAGSVRTISWIVLVTLLTGGTVQAVTPAAEVLPDTTCLYVSFPHMLSFQDSFEKTQLGQLAKDPAMKPFAEDFATQLKDRFGRTDMELGLKWDDLKGVYAGEACIARVQPGNKKTEHAVILMIDVTGKGAQVKKVRQTIATNMTKRKANQSTREIGNSNVTSYVLPRKRGQIKSNEVHLTVFDDQLFVTNHSGLLQDVLTRAQKKNSGGSLAEFKMFSEVMKQVKGAAAGVAPHVRWYLHPFKYAEVARASRRGRTPKSNIAKILTAQGFDAIRAAGGHLNLATNGYELLHRTFVYAPAVTNLPTRFNAAARMLVFPESQHSPAPTWLPRNIATYMSLNWKIYDGFTYSMSLIDAVVDQDSDGFVEDVLDSFKQDVGVDIRQDLLAHLDDRIVTFSDFKMPITTTSERLLFAVRIKNEKPVRLAIDRLGESEPQAERVKIAGLDGWEIRQREVEDDFSDFDLPGGGIPLPGEEEEPANNDLALPNAAIAIARGPNPGDQAYLFISSDIELLGEVLSNREDHDTLKTSDDFQFVNELLNKLGAGNDSIRSFSRSDEEYRSTYEMIRQGKMPQSESLIGRLLNRILGPEDRSQVRKPEFNGSKLPDYQLVRRYLGPSGVFMQPRKNGWAVTGIMISKDQLLNKGAQAQARLTSRSTK